MASGAYAKVHDCLIQDGDVEMIKDGQSVSE